MIDWVYVACGGALGAISRHAVNLAVMHLMGSTLVGTFVANITGSFVLGLLIAFWEPRDFPSEHRLFLAVGFLGSYTTFSTLAVATTQSFESGDIGRAAEGASLRGGLRGPRREHGRCLTKPTASNP